jgi:predicted Na+-dependent transporter
MDDPIPSKVVGVLLSVIVAAMVGLTVGYVAHSDFGVSRLDIRTLALTGAATMAPIVALLWAMEYSESCQNPNDPNPGSGSV